MSPVDVCENLELHCYPDSHSYNSQTTAIGTEPLQGHILQQPEHLINLTEPRPTLAFPSSLSTMFDLEDQLLYPTAETYTRSKNRFVFSDNRVVYARQHRVVLDRLTSALIVIIALVALLLLGTITISPDM